MNLLLSTAPLLSPFLALQESPVEETADGDAGESAAAPADEYDFFREQLELGSEFWTPFLTIEIACVTITVLGLWLLLAKGLPRGKLDAPRWGGLDVFAAFCVWMGIQVLIGGLATSLARFEVIPLHLEFPVTVALMAGVGLPALAAIVFMVRQRAHEGEHALGLAATGIPRGFLYGVGAWMTSVIGFLAVSAASIVVLLAYEVEPAQQRSLEIFREALEGDDYLSLAGIAVLAVVLAPLGEELIFRGLLFRWLEHRFGLGIGVVGSSFAFGVIHGNLAALVPLILLGVVFALLYRRTGNLWSAIFMHATFNGVMLMLAVLQITLSG